MYTYVFTNYLFIYLSYPFTYLPMYFKDFLILLSIMLVTNIVPQLLHLDEFYDMAWTRTTDLHLFLSTSIIFYLFRFIYLCIYLVTDFSILG
jgi:hypothetical protein